MANGGWHGTEEEWIILESPLRSLDPVLEVFAGAHGIALTKNGRDWPERSLKWAVREIRCLIQIFAKDSKNPIFDFWICAFQDRGDSRYWKKELLKKEAKASAIESELPKLLSSSKEKLDDWCSRPEEFEFATKLSPLPTKP